ncbi:site-specific integrase [Massilia sp. Leaf139]|uniref:site-specific integrase n=1 Tax=Massilia sp. Leaf139 TaxID=1736272 RepID=UPI000AA166AC|nr:site-specific integrase [Massilia sp. Leaf139]
MGRTGGVELRERSIRIRFEYRGKQRKETLYIGDEPMAPTPANAKYAKRLVAEIRQKIDNGTFEYAEYFPKSPHADEPEEGVPMLHQVMDKWIEVFDGKASTRGQYSKRLESFWKKALKDRPIGEVSYSDILTALNGGTWKSGKSRNNELSLINGVFEFARLDKLIKDNPCAEVKRAGYQKPAPDPFDLGEVNAILGHLREHRSEQILNFVQLMFFTGLRTSEGIALRWADIDFRKKEVLIDGANVYDEEADTTKTYESRVVKLNGMAVEALQRQKAHTYLAGAHVFHDPKTGEPWTYVKITDVRSFWQATLKKLGIRYRRPYSMRHTYATMGLMSGVKPGFMAGQLGHSLRMFFTVYAKWITGADDDREMDKLERAISASGEFPGETEGKSRAL